MPTRFWQSALDANNMLEITGYCCGGTGLHRLYPVAYFASRCTELRLHTERVTSAQIKKFVSMRDALTKEKASIDARLAEINQALGTDDAAPEASTPQSRVAKRTSGKKKAVRRKRASNPNSLKSVVIQVLKSKALDRREILKAVTQTGYKFTTKNPLNSLGAMLYSNKKEIRKVGKSSLQPNSEPSKFSNSR